MSPLPNTDHVELEKCDQDETGERSYEPLKPGWYMVELDDIKIVDGEKNGNKYQMLRFTAKVVDGPMKNRKIFDSFITKHTASERAVEIGLRKLKELKLAVGRPNAEHEDDLVQFPVMARVSIDKRNEQYNRIEEFRAAKDKPGAAKQEEEKKPQASGGRSWRQ